MAEVSLRFNFYRDLTARTVESWRKIQIRTDALVRLRLRRAFEHIRPQRINLVEVSLEPLLGIRG